MSYAGICRRVEVNKHNTAVTNVLSVLQLKPTGTNQVPACRKSAATVSDQLPVPMEPQAALSLSLLQLYLKALTSILEVALEEREKQTASL